MNCCQCQGIEQLFNEKLVTKELAQYRAKGPNKTSRMLIDALKENGVRGMTLLDIGGGIGAIQHELLGAGAASSTGVEASTAYIAASQAEAERRGLAQRVSHQQGDFVDLTAHIPPADIVTLDRVICCYPDMHKLVGLSAARARKLYGLVYPRDTWWVRIALAIENLFFRIYRSPFRVFVHPTESVDAIVKSHGLSLGFYRKTLVWQIMVYTRPADAQPVAAAD